MPLRLPARPLLYRRTLILLVHIALIPLAYLAAFGLRFDFQIPPQEFAHFQTTGWYLSGIRLSVFWAGGLYRGYWKHVGLGDLVDLGLAVTISSAAFVAALSLLGLLRGMPRSVFLLDWVVMIFFSGGIRFAARALRESRLARARLDDGRRTIIIGAGEGGEQLLRQVLHDPRAGMNVVGFVDDKPETHGRTLHGVPVLGHTGRHGHAVERATVRYGGPDPPHRGSLPRDRRRVQDHPFDRRSPEEARHHRPAARRGDRGPAGARPRAPQPRADQAGPGGQVDPRDRWRRLDRLGAGAPDRLIRARAAGAARARGKRALFHAPRGREGEPRRRGRAVHRQHHQPRPVGGDVPAVPAELRVPCRGLQARADAREQRDRGRVEQRVWHAARRRVRRPPRRGEVRADLDGQSGEPHQRARGHEAHRRAHRAGVAVAVRGRDRFPRRPVRQRAGLGRERRPAVQAADQRWRAGKGDAPRRDPLLHDDLRVGRAGAPGGGPARGRAPHLDSRDGQADPHPRARRAADPAIGPRALPRHLDRVQRPAPRRETRRGPRPVRRGHRRHLRRQDPRP